MFRSRTVFVIGAGASVELGLPTGVGLKSKIRKILGIDSNMRSFSDPVVNQSMVDFSMNSPAAGGQMMSAISAANSIAENMPIAPSIDTFLDSNQANEFVVATGKVAITRVILKEEAHCALYKKDRYGYYLPLDDQALNNSYLIHLWNHLVARVSPATVGSIFNNVSFIVFNYDRCLEHFLFLSLRSYFGLPDEAAASLIEEANIIHPYGKIGGLPWQKDNVKLSFGNAEQNNILPVALEINTFTESANDGVILRVKNIIRNAESIVFLGFGFLEENVDLLTCPSGATRVFMTTYEMSPADKFAALETTGRMIGKRANVNFEVAYPSTYQAFADNHTCAQLFSNNRLRIATEAPPVA